MGFRRIPLDLFDVRGWVPRPWGETRRAAAILTTHSFIKVISILYIQYLDVAHSLDMRAHVLSYFAEAAAVQRLVDRLSGVGDPGAGPEPGGWECVSSNRAGAGWRVRRWGSLVRSGWTLSVR